jgi:proliferating cell nuclear antigen
MQLLEATRELITEANFEVSTAGISLQAMDSSHVSLVSLTLRADGFSHFRCDRSFSMGMNLNNMNKMLKCAGNDDAITMRAEDGSDVVTFLFENPSGDRVAEFELKLMDITAENLGIPDTEYECTVRMPSSEFQRICRDLSTIGDTVEIAVTKDGVRFACAGDIGSANIMVRQHSVADRPDESTSIEMSEPVALTFALRYLNSFAKATCLSPGVVIKLSRELPVVVEYRMVEMGHVRYYLAPKIDEEEGEEMENE